MITFRSVELLELADMSKAPPAQAAAKLIALELFREEQVSLGKAAELAGMAQIPFDFLSFHFGMFSPGNREGVARH